MHHQVTADVHFCGTQQIGLHDGATARQRADSHIEGGGIKVLPAVGGDVECLDINLAPVAQHRLGAPGDVNLRVGASEPGEQATGRGGGFLEEVVVRLGAHAQHGSRQDNVAAQTRTHGTAVFRADIGHAHGRARTDAQRIGAGKAVLHCRGLDRDHRADTRQVHFGGADVSVHHAAHFVDGHRTRCGSSDQAKAGRCGQYLRVLLGQAVGQHCQVAFGRDAGQGVFAPGHCAQRQIDCAGDARFHARGDGVERHRATPGKGKADAARDRHGDCGGTAVDGGTVVGGDGDVAACVEHHTVGIGLGAAGNFIDGNRNTNRQCAGEGAKRRRYGNRQHAGVNAGQVVGLDGDVAIHHHAASGAVAHKSLGIRVDAVGGAGARAAERRTHAAAARSRHRTGKHRGLDLLAVARPDRQIQVLRVVNLG